MKSMLIVFPRLLALKTASNFFSVFLFCLISPGLLLAEDDLEALSAPKTRTVVADVLDVEGDFHIVRGERGEIRIEVTSDTKVSETFAYGDRIKAVLLPNDVALTITRAAPNEPTGIFTDEPTEPPASPSTPQETEQSVKKDADKKAPPRYVTPKVRVVIADLLMVDGSFYIVRTEFGEIQIEITPDTKVSEDFKFGDKIKARITPNDKALSVVRAGEDDPVGIHQEASSDSSNSALSAPPPVSSQDEVSEENASKELPAPEPPKNRTIVADVLMIDGDFIIVRGERGEIQIEVTPTTSISEKFDYGDRIKAVVLPNDKAITVERASPDDPIGITTP